MAYCNWHNHHRHDLLFKNITSHLDKAIRPNSLDSMNNYANGQDSHAKLRYCQYTLNTLCITYFLSLVEGLIGQDYGAKTGVKSKQ